MFGVGTTELLVILLIVLIIFGSKKLPELAQGLGKGIREFKKATNEIQDELDFTSPPSASPTNKKAHTSTEETQEKSANHTNNDEQKDEKKSADDETDEPKKSEGKA
ncbi:MAG: twin-arginine translocase TatA/TatE family subunit [Caldithrix sp.]|nr:twin-arginine translocase TatA/TatE family subunit [Caldithrix sp.]